MQINRVLHREYIQWSPCSNFIAAILINNTGSTSLQVLSNRLETMYVWLHEGSWADKVISVWAANSTFFGAAPIAIGPLQYHEACWNPHLQLPAECGEAAQFGELLAGIDAGVGDFVQHLSWGPGKAAAALVQLLHTHHVPNSPSGGQFSDPRGGSMFGDLANMYEPETPCKLHVLGAGQSMTSMYVEWSSCPGSQVMWSPAGDQLLLNSSHYLQLVTSACTPVVLLGGLPDNQLKSAVFSSDGVYFAAACHEYVNLYESKNGDIIHSMGIAAWHDPRHRWDIHFDDISDQLVLIGSEVVCITTFGWGSDSLRASSGKLCHAVATISNRATL